jgi:hypothetical protein
MTIGEDILRNNFAMKKHRGWNARSRWVACCNWLWKRVVTVTLTFTNTQGKDKGKKCILTTENHILMSPFAMPAPSLSRTHT